MSKEVVVVTGASGFVAQHLIRELQLTAGDWVKEIRLIDRLPFNKFLEYPDLIPTKFFLADCADTSALELILAGCGTVFHLAAKRLQLTLYADDNEYWHDNLTGRIAAGRESSVFMCTKNYLATEALVDQMIASCVPRIIFVGDALSNIPVGDHIGLSEGIMLDAPTNGSYILGAYGESKFRAELYVRNATGQKMHNGATLSSIMLRPTILYGEGESTVVPGALKFADFFGSLPLIGGGESGKYQMVR
uniref:3-beta hydroxysteroid dehydrogenase/isomerase domain-containing protein n=1 Tax=Plectus sambesii TaxID=2011161 RepID=A0A914XNA1_9BILA